MIELKFIFDPEKDFIYPEKIKIISNALKTKNKIDTMYDEVFRTHIKHSTPIIGKRLTERDMDILNTILNKINEHFKDME